MSPVTLEPNGAMHCDELDQQLVIVLVVQSKAWEPCAPTSGNGDVWWRGVEGKKRGQGPQSSNTHGFSSMCGARMSMVGDCSRAQDQLNK